MPDTTTTHQLQPVTSMFLLGRTHDTSNDIGVTRIPAPTQPPSIPARKVS